MATAGGRDEMRTPLDSELPLGRSAFDTLQRSERMRPAVLAILVLAAVSGLLPGAPAWLGLVMGASALAMHSRFRRAAYRFVGTPNGDRRDTAEFWGLTNMAYLLFTLPVLTLVLAYQVILSVVALPG